MSDHARYRSTTHTNHIGKGGHLLCNSTETDMMTRMSSTVMLARIDCRDCKEKYIEETADE